MPKGLRYQNSKFLIIRRGLNGVKYIYYSVKSNKGFKNIVVGSSKLLKIVRFPITSVFCYFSSSIAIEPVWASIKQANSSTFGSITEYVTAEVTNSKLINPTTEKKRKFDLIVKEAKKLVGRKLGRKIEEYSFPAINIYELRDQIKKLKAPNFIAFQSLREGIEVPYQPIYKSQYLKRVPVVLSIARGGAKIIPIAGMTVIGIIGLYLLLKKSEGIKDTIKLPRLKRNRLSNLRNNFGQEIYELWKDVYEHLYANRINYLGFLMLSTSCIYLSYQLINFYSDLLTNNFNLRRQILVSKKDILRYENIKINLKQMIDLLNERLTECESLKDFYKDLSENYINKFEFCMKELEALQKD